MAMQIDAVLTPDTFRSQTARGKVVLVVDVLRASTTLTTALANGAERIFLLKTPEEAREKVKTLVKEKTLLCGERGGVKVDGFDLGNSPREYDRSVVRNRVLCYSSTNGSGMMVRAGATAEEVWIAGFVNRTAAAEKLARIGRNGIVVCSGREGQFSIEDAVCAGMIIDTAMRKNEEGCELGDEARAALILFRQFADDLVGTVRNSAHGRFLASLGLEDDLPLCTAVDRFDFVPVLKNGGLLQ